MNLPCSLQSVFSIKGISLIVISVQSTSMILLLRYSRTLQQEEGLGSVNEPRLQYVISTAVFLTEVLKFLFSLLFLLMENGYNFHNARETFQQEVVGKLSETVKLVVPAGLYFIQNSLVYIALTNLDAATYQAWSLLCVSVLSGQSTYCHAEATKVTYQLRILFTALCLWLLMGRRLTFVHWLSLSCLTVGVALVQVNTVDSSANAASSHLEIGTLQPKFSAFENSAALPEHIKLEDTTIAAKMFTVDSKFQVAAGKGGETAQAKNLHFLKESKASPTPHPAPPKVVSSAGASSMSWLLGLLAVLVCCAISGFAGVYFEYLVKMSRQTSLVVRNIQLGLFSLAFSSLGVCNNAEQLWSGGFFQGYSWATFIVIMLQASGGLVVSLTMKYADNILKVFATSVSIVLSTLLSTSVMGQTTPGPYFVYGTFAVLCATLLYGLVPAPAASDQPSQSIQKTYAGKNSKVLFV